MLQRVHTSLVATGAAGVYVLSMLLGCSAHACGARFPIALLPAGLAAGALLRWGPRWWPALAVAASTGAWLLGASPARAVTDGLLAACGATASVWLLRRVGFHGDFGQPRSVGRFTLGVAGGAFATALATVAVRLAEPGGWQFGLGAFAGRIWLDTLLSLLLVVPLVLATDRSALQWRAAGQLEAAAWAIFLGATVGLVLGLPPHYIGIPAFAGVLLAIAWAVARLNLPCALAGACLGALAAAISASFQVGLLADDAMLRAQRLAWNAGFMFTLTALVLNAFLTAHERAERRSRTLFRESPEPVWLTDPQTGRFLDVNAAAAAVYGWSAAEFAQLCVNDVVVHSDAIADALGAGTHQVHRRRDGRLLRVYARTRELRLDESVAQLWFNVDVTERSDLRAALRRAGNEERARVSRELHDGLGQELTGIAFVLGGMSTQVKRGTPVTADEIARVAEFARGALESCRRIVSGMSPVDVGATLQQALQAMVSRLDGGDAHVALVVDPDATVFDTPDFVADQLLRICQEALANALRHSGARQVTVRLGRSALGVTLTVSDDGCGFDQSTVRSGMGLRTLRMRAEEIGAMLTVDAAPGRGVCVECRYLDAAQVA